LLLETRWRDIARSRITLLICNILFYFMIPPVHAAGDQVEGHCQEQDYTPHLQQFTLLYDPSSPCCWRPDGETLLGARLLSSSATVYSTFTSLQSLLLETRWRDIARRRIILLICNSLFYFMIPPVLAAGDQMERHCQEQDYSPHLQQFILLYDPSSPC